MTTTEDNDETHPRVGCRVPRITRDRIEYMAERYPLTMSAILRRAIELGLDAIDLMPATLLGAPHEARGGE